MIWHLHRIVLDVLFFRMTDFKLFNSSSVSSILYFFGLAIGEITAVSFIIPENGCNSQKYLTKYQYVSTLDELEEQIKHTEQNLRKEIVKSENLILDEVSRVHHILNEHIADKNVHIA